MSFFTGLRRQELGSLTPRSFKLDDAQPTLMVEAACSKHRRKDTLPMHPELVALVREWVRDLEPDDLLFPRIERKKTWLMVKKDLERVGIPYETHEGIADFHAAGRHSHITGLLRIGGVARGGQGTGPARRHPDDDEVHPHRHAGPGRSPGRAAIAKHMRITLIGWTYGWVSGGVLGQEVSAGVSEADRSLSPETNKPRPRPGFASSAVTNCHQLAV